MKTIFIYWKTEQVKYVLRNIGRKKKQTFFTTLCIFISSSIILGNIALNNGIIMQLKEGINNSISGQLTVYSSDRTDINILESQLKEQNIFNWDSEDKQSLNQFSDGLTAYKRIRFSSLVSYKDETSYLFVHALEKPHLDKIKRLLSLQKGTMPDNDNQILISETTADELHCSPGDTLLLVSENRYDYLSDELAVVSGIFEEKGLALFFNYISFIPYTLGENIVQLNEEECLELVINPVYDKDLTEQNIAKIDHLIGEKDGDIQTATWEKTVPLFYTIVHVWKGGKMLTQAIFTIFSLLILITLTSLIVNSRKKEFGTLLAIGFSWGKITQMVCVEYSLITSCSVMSSVILTELLIYFFPETGVPIMSKDLQAALMSDSLRPIIYPANVLYVLLLFTFTTIVSVCISLQKTKKQYPAALINNPK